MKCGAVEYIRTSWRNRRRNWNGAVIARQVGVMPPTGLPDNFCHCV